MPFDLRPSYHFDPPPLPILPVEPSAAAAVVEEEEEEEGCCFSLEADSEKEVLRLGVGVVVVDEEVVVDVATLDGEVEVGRWWVCAAGLRR